MDVTAKLLVLGLTEQKAKETAKNESLTSVLVSITDQVIITGAQINYITEYENLVSLKNWR